MNSRVIESLKWRLSNLYKWMMARISLLLARILGLKGTSFGWFGFWCSRCCRKAGYIDLADELLITPVSCVRYREFDFARRSLAQDIAGNCLDVSSPRLFSSYVLKNHSDIRVEIVNPDPADLSETRKLLDGIGIAPNRFGCHEIYADKLPWKDEVFDCVWSISVIEHIPVPDDAAVLKELWRVLKPGGQLILTFPVAPEGYDEFRKRNTYGLARNKSTSRGSLFFQRWYDEKMVSDRVLNQLSDAVVQKTCVFGERKKGWYASYEDNWLKYGERITCKDAFYCATKFASLRSLNELKSSGILALNIGKKV